MGEDFEGQKRHQDLMQYSMACSFFSALVVGWALHSTKAGWYTYLVGLFFTWLINVVEWNYFFAPPTTWAEGKYLDITGYLDLEARDKMAMNQGKEPMSKRQRAQITLLGGPAKMTISSRPPLPEFKSFRKW